MANVFIDDAILQNWGDFIREKTGTTDKMLPSALLTRTQENWGTAGGSCEDVRYVTFMNGENTLYKKAVAVGDDCVDVLTKGLIELPTKESTVDTVYTYSGWSLTDGGTADSTALEAVTEDRTVYASFVADARYYTIRFFDGETLLESMSVAYGDMPTITNPEKEGYSFDGWDPDIVSVTGDAEYFAKWVEAITFAGGSWQDIIRISESGEASKYFSVGDTREDTMTYADGTTEPVILQIAGFDVDELFDGSGKAGMTIINQTLLSKKFTVFNETKKTYKGKSSMTSGGWAISDARKFCANTLLKGLPADVVEHVKTVNKISDTGYHDHQENITQDKVFVLSAHEIWTTVSYAINVQGTRYPVMSKYSSNVRQQYGATQGLKWYTRTTYSTDYDFQTYGADGLGQILGTNVGNANYFVFGFCI